jgi:hypothetical protein
VWFDKVGFLNVFICPDIEAGSLLYIVTYPKKHNLCAWLSPERMGPLGKPPAHDIHKTQSLISSKIIILKT